MDVEFCWECQGTKEDPVTGLPCWKCDGLGSIDVEEPEFDDDEPDDFDGNPEPIL